MKQLVQYRCVTEELFFVFRETRDILRDIGAAYGEDREKESIIAGLCVDLIERYGYRLANIQVKELLPFVAEKKLSYTEIDIMVTDKTENPVLLVEVLPHEEYEFRLHLAMQKLFSVAHAIGHDSPLLSLMCYTRWHEGELRKESISVVDTRRFPTYELWQSSGFACETEIPRRKNIGM